MIASKSSDFVDRFWVNVGGTKWLRLFLACETRMRGGLRRIVFTAKAGVYLYTEDTRRKNG